MSQLILALAAVIFTVPQPTKAKLPQSLDFTTIRAVATQHDGRWPPLDTVARDLVDQVTGDPIYQGHDPVKILLAWTFDPEAWMFEPLIAISNAELRGELKLPLSQTAFSYTDLIGHAPFLTLLRSLDEARGGRKLNPLESKVSSISEQLGVLQMILGGSGINLIPDPKDANGAWHPIRVPREPSSDEDDSQVVAAWAALHDAFMADDGPAFTSASRQLVEVLATLPAAYRPAQGRIDTELRYNALRPFHIAWIIMAAGAVLATLALFVRRRVFDILPLLALIAGFAALTYGLWMRWQVAGRIPASNMFESLLFLSWGMGLFAIVAILIFRDRLIPLTASFMAALSLVLADILPLDGFVRPIVPVLADTFWMSIHVPVIMVSYSVLALGVLIAHVQLVVMAVAPQRRKLATAIDLLHYWYIHVGSILLLAGIVTGSMWAASSWGRYWGWDPKEVWSLVALLGYLTILHVRIGTERVPAWAYAAGALLTAVLFATLLTLLAPVTATTVFALAGTLVAMAVFVLAHGQFATAVKSILCFWLIIMTYVGVNYVLGTGLHSYGFGTGAVARWMFRLGGADLALMAFVAAIYLARRGWRQAGSPAMMSAGTA